MPNKNSEAFELNLKQLVKNDANRAYNAYQYFCDSRKLFNNKALDSHLADLADIQIQLYKVLCDKFYNRYGEYPNYDDK